MFENICMMKKIRVGWMQWACEQNVCQWAAGRSHGHAIQERQLECSVLTNQCLEKKKQMLSHLGEE
jgi:hypothetical protein